MFLIIALLVLAAIAGVLWWVVEAALWIVAIVLVAGAVIAFLTYGRLKSRLSRR